MTFPSNFTMTMVGDTSDTLIKTLELLGYGDQASISGYSELDAHLEEPDHTEEGAISRLPVLVLYAYSNPGTPATTYRAKKMSKPSSIAHFIYSWLDELPSDAFGPQPSGEDCRRGWRLNAGYETIAVGEYNSDMQFVSVAEQFPDIGFYGFRFMIRPEWTFYSR